jgi:tRNA/rRNA methyltransferase
MTEAQLPDGFSKVKRGALAPEFGESGVQVAAIVKATHERSIAQGLDELALPGLEEALEEVLTYCAEQRCVGDGVVCKGCRLETERSGIADLDQFVASYRKVRTARAGLEISGGGAGERDFESLEALAAGWAGEAYWFWARRVLRKLRHGVRRAHIQGRAFAGEGETPAVILMEPQLADNIGMVARAMGNFGLDTLRLVAPRDGWPNEKARIAASGANYVIDDAVATGSLGEAIGDLNWVCATTARQRDLAKPVLTPEQAVAEMLERIGRGERCGILFGRERNGLETDEVAIADAVVMIPVNPRFASLNLAQAVLLMGYEWLKGSQRGTLGRVTTYEREIEAGLRLRGSEPADKSELLGFFEHIEDELEKAGFFNPPHKRQTVVRNLRSMFLRMGATKQEVQTLRGIVATLGRGRGVPRKSP